MIKRPNSPKTSPSPPCFVRSRSLTTSCRRCFFFFLFPPSLVIPPVVPPPCCCGPGWLMRWRKTPGAPTESSSLDSWRRNRFFSEKEKKSVAASPRREPPAAENLAWRHLTETMSGFSGRLSRYFRLSATSALLQRPGVSLSQKQNPLQSPDGNVASELWSGQSLRQLKPWHGN